MPSNRLRAWTAPGLIVTATAAAYATSFGGAFVFDDIPSILGNPTIRGLWPLARPLHPPGGDLTVSARPLLNLSLAVSYALSGYRPWAYHAVNLAIHLAAALTLYGVARRTLLRQGTRRAESNAFAIALLWAVHPLATAAVTYLVQRAEALAAFFCLATLYGFIRSTDERGSPGGPPSADAPGWLIFSVSACFLGAATKEVIVSVPVVVYLYDRIFVAKSWAGPWRARRAYYCALAASWAPLLALTGQNGWNRGASAGFRVGTSWWDYWRSQGEALFGYARLAVWPHPLVFDYGPSTVAPAIAWLLFAVIATALAAALVGAGRGRPWSFPVLGAFLVLAPTSLIPGISQFMAEHRAYLPLAAVLTGVVLGADRLMASAFRTAARPRAIRGGLLIAAVASLGAATSWRNLRYRSDMGLWLDTAAKRPANALAPASIGEILLAARRFPEAVPYCEQAVRLRPDWAGARFNLGLAYEQNARWSDAEAQYAAAVSLQPGNGYASFRAGLMLERLGRPALAEFWLRRAVAANPGYAEAQAALAELQASRRPAP
ncbi:MAG TPA: tetratricopeptide repeat protein [Opitutaceae bacterium]|jgi:hypothetical protein|nr:tetratricopeptide repeat protein [Opitutaceae bacterium]